MLFRFNRNDADCEVPLFTVPGRTVRLCDGPTGFFSPTVKQVLARKSLSSCDMGSRRCSNESATQGGLTTGNGKVSPFVTRNVFSFFVLVLSLAAE